MNVQTSTLRILWQLRFVFLTTNAIPSAVSFECIRFFKFLSRSNWPLFGLRQSAALFSDFPPAGPASMTHPTSLTSVPGLLSSDSFWPDQTPATTALTHLHLFFFPGGSAHCFFDNPVLLLLKYRRKTRGRTGSRLSADISQGCFVRLSSRGLMNCQPPIFSGSSWTQHQFFEREYFFTTLFN